MRRIAAFALIFGALFIIEGATVQPVEARCCDRSNDGCDGASETGCAMGSVQNMFFPDPCICSSGACVDPTQGNGPCGGTPPGDCGDGVIDSGEDCDDGTENGTFMSCCAIDCTFKPSDSVCDDGTFCDGLGACNGEGTCVENNGPLICLNPERCDEEHRRCEAAGTPAVSTAVLGILAATMLGGALLILRRRRLQQNIR